MKPYSLTFAGMAIYVACAAAVTAAEPDERVLQSTQAAQQRPVELAITAPDSRNFRGLTGLTRWPLTIRLEARRSVAVVEAAETDSRREAVVLSDPDGCIDMRDFPFEQPALPYEDCDGPDETWFEFTSERFNSFDLEDERTGNSLVRAALVDDPFVAEAVLNKPYLRNSAGEILPLPRPQTGEALLDGYGYGADDDLPGLVIMADIGGARVFDPDFNRTPGLVRNLAGFINTVSLELRTTRGGTAVTATTHVLAGLFEPVALFDLDVDDPGVDFLRRLESGAIDSFTFLAPPADDDELFRELMTTYSPIEVDIHAVLVEGIAPSVIQDVNRDGRFTEADVRRMGYTLLSNQARRRILLELDPLITQTSSGRTCPPRSLIFSDLDGNGRSGQVNCSGSGGAARLRRVPR